MFVATDKAILFEQLQIHLDQELGSGAYGQVFRAYCDHLPCAAKVVQLRRRRSDSWLEKMSRNNFLSSLSNTSSSSPGAEEKYSFNNFMNECNILKRMQHPCIIQYLGVAMGVAGSPHEGSIAVLMELAGTNLTHLLHRRRSLPVPLQLQFCRDVALGVAYLHANHVIHRDLSSHNVLVVGNSKLKLSDFGMAATLDPSGNGRLDDPIPGTEAYMPPEAFPASSTASVSYAHKLDCFAYGVLSLQIVTRKFPRPSPCRKKIPLPFGQQQVWPVRGHHGNPNACPPHDNAEGKPTIVWKTVGEVERRKRHLDLVGGAHPMLQLLLQCLMDNEENRPSADSICQELEMIIRTNRLSQVDQMAVDHWLSSKDIPHPPSPNSSDTCCSSDEDDEQFRCYPGELKNDANYPASEGGASPRSCDSASYIDLTTARDTDPPWQLSWKREVRVTEEKLQRGHSICYRNKILVNWNRVISRYKPLKDSWQEISRNAHLHSSLAVISSYITTVGGVTDATPHEPTNALRSLNKRCSWVNKFPAMPTKRHAPFSIMFNGGIVVAGGKISMSPERDTDVVEILNEETLTWTRAASLPRALSGGSMVLNDYFIFIVGEQSLYQCSLGDLLDSTHSTSVTRVLRRQWTSLMGVSQQKRSVWQYASHCPLHRSTLAGIHGNLVALGGMDKSKKVSSAVYKYDMWEGKWEELDPMGTPRYCSLVETVSVGESSTILVVLGGCGKNNTPCSIVEVAEVSHTSTDHTHSKSSKVKKLTTPTTSVLTLAST